MSGKISLVATPIGNMEDITLRALRVLAEADVIMAEDTRRTAQLLARHSIRRPMESCPAFREGNRAAAIAERVDKGERLALVSDAGTPGISDPGGRLVRACLERGLAVEVIPGPCAAIAALSISGLPTHEFHFVGFLPPKRGPKERRLRGLASMPGTLVIYESPHRLVATLEIMKAVFGDRPVVVGREITKKFEEFRRGTSDEIVAWFRAHPPRGEFVVLVGEDIRKDAGELASSGDGDGTGLEAGSDLAEESADGTGAAVP